MTNFIALLRGINVGGNNIIKMSDLKACFEKLGLSNVTTYIQSGNVLFQASGSAKGLTSKIERGLSKAFKYNSSVVLLSQAELQTIIKQAPKGFGLKAALFRYDVVFLKDSLLPKQAIQAFKIKEGVDTAHAGTKAVYFSRLVAKASQSQLSRITQHPLYQKMTIRNWNTASKLLQLSTATPGPARAIF